MACARCDQKGYLETLIAASNGFRSQLKQCPDCRDIHAYTKRVQELLATTQGFEEAPSLKPVRRFKLIQGGRGHA